MTWMIIWHRLIFEKNMHTFASDNEKKKRNDYVKGFE
jgi:hypothetical protein